MTSIQAKLAAHGHRLTKPRQAIFTVLSHQPQSVLEISQKLSKKKLQIDKVTIYRTLDCFVNLGLANKTQFKDQTFFYELADHKHHHHVVCEGCGKIADIELDEAELLQKVRKNSPFQIKSHHLEFFGLCQKCH